MERIKGVIQEVIKQQRGANTMVDIVVGGQKYGAGLEKFFKAKAGQYVEFDLDEERGFKNVARGSLKAGEFKGVTEDTPKGSGSPVAATVAKSVSSFDARQDAISRQAASNTAISWLEFLASQDALPAITAKAKGAKQETLDTLRREYEREFYEHNTGVVWKSIAPNAPKESTDDATSDNEAPADGEWK